MATFPGGIKAWKSRRNQADDVDAFDVNSLYDEVSAMQRTLGMNPQMDYTLNGKRNDWGTVGSRLASLHRGLDIPVLRLESPGENVPPGKGPWTQVNFDAPNRVTDPTSMFNGIGFTIKRSGWYIVSGDCRWPFNVDGYRLLSMFANETELAGDSKSGLLIGAQSQDLRQNFSWQGYLYKDYRMSMRVYQTSNVTLKMKGVTLSATFIRE